VFVDRPCSCNVRIGIDGALVSFQDLLHIRWHQCRMDGIQSIQEKDDLLVLGRFDWFV
jgi:hypothetical protein